MSVSALRAIREQDRETIQEMVREMITELGTRYDAALTEGNVKKLTDFVFVLAANGQPALLATVDGQAAGFTALMPGCAWLELREKTMFDIGTYVKPEYRLKGLGQQLRRAAAALARAAGFEKITIPTHVENEPARRSLEKCGAKPVVTLYQMEAK